jgi:hypothetical protein
MVLNRMAVNKLKDPGRGFVKRELLYPVIELKVAA